MNAASHDRRPGKRSTAKSRLLFAFVFALLASFWYVAYRSGQSPAASTQSAWLGALLIFLLRLSDMTLDTMRLMFTIRGHKYRAALVGFMQAALVVVAIARVVRNVSNPFNIVAYAGGYATGIFVGMTLEERLALGFSHLQIISREKGAVIAEALREAGHAATVLSGTGKDGVVSIVSCTVRRRDAKAVKALADDIDAAAFVTGEEVRPLARGYFRV